MNELMTVRQVQETLKVDRITVYRMLNDGRLKGVKIGHQWRFQQGEVLRLLGLEQPAETPVQPADTSFPTRCVQTIQELFSEISELGALVIDAQGKPLTQPTRMCMFCQALHSSPSGKAACGASWQSFAQNAGAPGALYVCHAGLQYLGAPVMKNGEMIGLFLVGPFFWQPPDVGQEAGRVTRLAAEHNLPVETLSQAANTIPVIAAGEESRLRTWPVTAARAVQHIIDERSGFMDRLQQIASLTQFS